MSIIDYQGEGWYSINGKEPSWIVSKDDFEETIDMNAHPDKYFGDSLGFPLHDCPIEEVTYYGDAIEFETEKACYKWDDSDRCVKRIAK